LTFSVSVEGNLIFTPTSSSVLHPTKTLKHRIKAKVILANRIVNLLSIYPANRCGSAARPAANFNLLTGLTAAFAGCEARSAEQPADVLRRLY
jgi:hypothetical protein